jgi:hypothetical protein
MFLLNCRTNWSKPLGQRTTRKLTLEYTTNLIAVGLYLCLLLPSLYQGVHPSLKPKVQDNLQFRGIVCHQSMHTARPRVSATNVVLRMPEATNVQSMCSCILWKSSGISFQFQRMILNQFLLSPSPFTVFICMALQWIKWHIPSPSDLWANLVGHSVLILLDSGSSISFVSSAIAYQLPTPPVPCPSFCVQVANGSKLSCSSQIVDAVWSVQGCQFVTTLKVLDLQPYDMVIGMDWLSLHSPMMVHWADRWLSITVGSSLVKLYGVQASGSHGALVQLCSLSDLPDKEQSLIQSLPPVTSAAGQIFFGVCISFWAATCSGLRSSDSIASWCTSGPNATLPVRACSQVGN